MATSPGNPPPVMQALKKLAQHIPVRCSPEPGQAVLLERQRSDASVFIAQGRLWCRRPI